jgi:subtilisin family serine protease
MAAAGPAGAQAEAPAERVYIVQLSEPAALPAARALAGASRRSADGRTDLTAAGVRRYAAGLVESHDRALAAVGAADAKVYSYRLAFNGFAARLTPAQAAKLARQPGVARVWPDRVRRLDTNASASFLGLLDPATGLRSGLGLKGEDVVIGVIDSGITPDHPSFADTVEKKKPRICRSAWAEDSLLGLWLCKRFDKPRLTRAYDEPEGWNGRCKTGEGFPASACNHKLIGARFYDEGFRALYDLDANEFVSPKDADGHGTHIASVAAGNPVKAAIGGTTVADVSGIAPRARVAVYKACWLEPGATRATCAMSDLQRAIEDAVADGVDIINYSIGATDGGPTDPDSLALLEASDAGILAVVAAGNGGPGASTIDSPGSAPWVLTVAASSRTGRRFDEALRVTSPASAAGDFTMKEAAFTPALRATGEVKGLLVLAADGEGDGADACEPLTNADVVKGRVALARRGSCDFDVKVAVAEDAGATAVVVITDGGSPIIMKGERGSVGIPAVMIGRADGDAIVARLDAGDAVEVSLLKGRIATRNEAGNRMYTESSRGPNPITFDILKPDVTAPGANILGAQAPAVANGVRGELYQYLSGTSMAVPQVAGLAALLREAHPDWSPAALRSALVTTARQDLTKEDGVLAADPFDFGGGHVVPNRALEPGLVYEAGREDYDAFACGAGIPRVSDEECAALADAGWPTAIDELNLPSLATSGLVGERSVRRRVTNVGAPGTWQAVVEAPAGVTVAVEPATLALGTGDTAEFTVTFANAGDAGRLGQWGFGALTWVNGAQAVRSPVAVLPAALAAPDAVSGTGAGGEATLEVRFGYAGTFGVGTAGLFAPALFTGQVLDDPLDFYYVLDDDAALPDHVRRFRITVPAGARYLRVALDGTDDGALDDLDLYLLCPGGLCPGGTEGLGSTGDGAREFIDIVAPDGGEYVIDVHGFETDEVTGGTGANFAVRAWVVTDDGGLGALQATAPAAATVGGTGEVTASWTGLPAGDVYLGLLRYDDGAAILGETLLEVVVE